MDGGAARIRHGVFDLHQWRLWLAGLIGSRYDGLCHFHVVEPGVLLRSGQPDQHGLAEVLQNYHIRTVVNLRGSDPNESWWVVVGALGRLGMAKSELLAPHVDRLCYWLQHDEWWLRNAALSVRSSRRVVSLAAASGWSMTHTSMTQRLSR